MQKTSGFTMVELIVVLAVFSILMLVGTDFAIKMVRENNQTSIKNDVRQNANSIMQLLANAIRKAGCVSWTGTSDITITTYSDVDCNVTAEQFSFKTLGSENGRVYRNGSKIIPDKIAACADAGCGSTCSQNGLIITGTSGTKLPVKITLTLQQTPKADIRSDFCGRITLTNTITPRQY